MARKKTITKRRRGLFLAKLKATGQVTAAAIAGEIGRSSWYDLKDRDPEFADEWDTAERTFLDYLESQGISRAVVGVNEDVPYTSIDKDGNKVTRFRTINRKSDRLLELTLKSRHPEYKPTKLVEQTSPDGSMTPSAVSTMPDLSNLSDDEVQTLTELTRKAHGTAAIA